MMHLMAQALRRVAPLVRMAAFGLTAAWGAPAAAAQAQAGTVSGTVVDAKTTRPLADAVVVVEGSTAGARTGVRGEFRLTGLTGASVRLRVTRIGYQPLTQEVKLGGAPVRFELTESIVKLDELVVTGTAGEAQKRTLGNALGRVPVAEVVQIAPPVKLQDMLSVNVPGVRITRPSGAVGTGGLTRIRGAGSLSLSNEPLIYIDGIRTNNQGAVANAGPFDSWADASRVNDLDPEEIESIEILKGPSAATIYGTEASNGVIQIITKRGRSGRPTFDVHGDAGGAWLMDPEGRYPSNFYIGRDGGIHEYNVLSFLHTHGFTPPAEGCPQPFQQEGDRCTGSIFSTGHPVASGGSISGGTDQLRYFFSADYNRDEGYLDYNWQNKYNGRANLSYTTPNDKFKIDLSVGNIHSKTRGIFGFQVVTTSIIWACNFPGCEPAAGADSAHTGWNGLGHGFQFYRPEDYYHVFAYDYLDRTTYSVQVSHRPFPWLRHHLTVGPDFSRDKTTDLIEKDGTGFNGFFAWSAGYKGALEQRSTFLTVDYGASADLHLRKDLLTTTSVGAQYYHKQFDLLHAVGQDFSIPGPSDITGAASRTADETFLENKTLGFYGQEQVAWKNRVFLTAALRGDGNSSFGANFSAAYYPKLSLSWVLSDEPFLAHSSVISQLKLRGAWGRAGQQPEVFSAIRTYQPKVGPQGQGGVSPQNYGNPNLKPEIGEETELGFDAGLFNQRMGIEFTFYNKDIKDAIVSVPLRPSSGFPGFTFLNIGSTRNRGIELAVDGTPINSRNLGLDLRFSLATNQSKITDMGGIEPLFLGIDQFHVQGFAPASYFYKNVVSSTIVKRDIGGIQLPVGTNVMCEGGKDLGLGDGTTVPCENAPRLYAGRVTPSWNGSFSATLTLRRRLRLLALVDYIGGEFRLSGDVWGIHSFFLSSKAAFEGSSQILSGMLGTYYAGDCCTIDKSGLFDAGFAKLRTVSLGYDVPERIARWVGASRGSITVAGENLLTLWRAQSESFGVKWIDSEISTNRNDSFGLNGYQGYVQESFPQAARIRTTVRLTF